VLLKAILSSEETSHMCGDIDSTVMRVLCTLLLICVYLGSPVPSSPLHAHAVAARMKKAAATGGVTSPGDTAEPVIVEVSVQVCTLS
jgi:hypothetical protein